MKMVWKAALGAAAAAVGATVVKAAMYKPEVKFIRRHQNSNHFRPGF